MAFSEKLKNEIQNIMNGKNIYLNEPMKNHTSFKIGGPADILLIPKTYEEISRISKLCIKENIPYYVIGNGSNLLVKDGGIRGVVIKTTGLDKIEIKDEKVIAQSGALLSDVSKAAAENALTGLEFACGIPGSIGGAITMNAGAYNGEISFIADSCKVLDKTGNIIELNREHLELGYRQSAIMKHGYIVLEVTFKLQKGDHNKIQSRIDDLTKRRTEKQPLEYPSAGSTFKRPEGHYASKLIQDSNLKGTHVGDAEVSQKHSGFIINKGNASAKDILDLIKIVQEIVYEKFQVQLEPEVRIIGEE